MTDLAFMAALVRSMAAMAAACGADDIAYFLRMALMEIERIEALPPTDADDQQPRRCPG